MHSLRLKFDADGIHFYIDPDKLLPTEEIGAPVASFIKACLRLDSSERPFAREFELHP